MTYVPMIIHQGFQIRERRCPLSNLLPSDEGGRLSRSPSRAEQVTSYGFKSLFYVNRLMADKLNYKKGEKGNWRGNKWLLENILYRSLGLSLSI